MGKREEPAEGAGGGRTERGLEAYLREFRELAAAYGEKAASLAPDPDTRPLIDHYTRVVQEQLSALSRRMISAYDGAGDELRSEVDQVLEMTAGRTLTAGARQPMTTIRSVGALGAAVAIFPIIKKILRLLADVLGISIPKLLDAILELIDELLGEQANNVSDAAGERAHRSEIKFLEAQYHLTRLTQLKESGGNDRDNGDGN